MSDSAPPRAEDLTRPEALEELRRSFKRMEGLSRKLAREMGRIEDLSKRAGVPIRFESQ